MQLSRGFHILKHPITIPGVQIESVGAGGGSIAVLEEAGGLARLRVGPESAGSHPGPAAYNRGGDRPTVTDANLVLGILNADVPLGGEIALSVDRARDTIRTTISDRLGQDVVRSAWGIYQVITAQMADAVEHFMVSNGVDVRQHALMAFGAATPQHALAIASRLGCPKVIIPAASPVFSAYGLMMTDIRHAYEITDDSVRFPIDASGVAVEEQEIDMAERELSLSIDMRYAGQELQLPVDLTSDFAEHGTVDELRATIDAWREKYAQVYGDGAVWSDGSIEVIHYRAVAVGRLDTASGGARNGAAAASTPTPTGTREVYLGRPLQAQVYAAADLVPGAEIVGPAVIDGELTTVVLGPEDRLSVDAAGNFVAVPGGGWL
jgi:N-methylhydantoinase A